MTFTAAASSSVAQEIPTVEETLDGIDTEQQHDEAVGSDIAEEALEELILDDNSAGSVPLNVRPIPHLHPCPDLDAL